LLYNQAIADLNNGTHDWDSVSQTYKVMLVSTGYTFSPTHEYVSDFSVYELNGTNYQNGFSGTGRKTLTSRSVNIDDINNYVELSADDVSYPAINAGKIGGVIIYRHLTNDNASKSIFCFTGGVLPFQTMGGDFSIEWSNGVVAYIKASGTSL